MGVFNVVILKILGGQGDFFVYFPPSSATDVTVNNVKIGGLFLRLGEG